jgi:hypothetical protein
MAKIKSHKTPTKHAKRVAASSGTFMGIRIADPIVKPRGTTIRKIREAVAASRKQG